MSRVKFLTRLAFLILCFYPRLLFSDLYLISLEFYRLTEIHHRLNSFLSEILDESRRNSRDDSEIAFLFDKSGVDMYNINKNCPYRAQFICPYA